MKAHAFQDTDGDGLCDFETDFARDRPGFVERRCLQGEKDWPHRLTDALNEELPAGWNGPEGGYVS